MKKQKKVLLQDEPVLLQNTFGNVFLSLTRTDEYIEAKWQGYITAEDVVAAGRAYLSFLQLCPCPKLLNDKSDVTGDWIDANSWLEYEWLPQVVEAGLRCITHVYSKDLFSQIASREIYSRLSSHLQIKIFTDRYQAIQWLLTCDTDLATPLS